MAVAGNVPFWKMSGSGNDFVVIDNRDGVISAPAASVFTRAVCRHRVSVGADGVVLIETSQERGVHFRWRYINADGSDGEMCGNGAMCGARFAFLNDIAPATCVFRTESGLVHADVDPDPASTRVKIAVAPPGPLRRDIALEVAGQSLSMDAIVVGVPHAVAIVANADGFPENGEFTALGRAVRHHEQFAPAGTNWNVIEIRDTHTIRMRTYERGVEDETLACGTGAIASAISAVARGIVATPVGVITTGGRILTADFRWDGAQATDVTLGGEARVIVRGVIDAEALA